jgi:hypothetical protein
MADQLEKEAADEWCTGRQFDYDLPHGYTQPFRHKCWLQQTIQVQTAEGLLETCLPKRPGRLMEKSSA